MLKCLASCWNRVMGPHDSIVFSNFKSQVPLRKLRNLILRLTRRPWSSQIFLTGSNSSMLASMCLRTLTWKRSKQKLEKELREACLLWEDSEGGKYVFISSDIWLLISSCYLQGLLHPSDIVVSLSCNIFFKFLLCVSTLFV